MTQATFSTCDLCDTHEADQSGAFRVLAPGYQSYGGIPRFFGPAVVLRALEDSGKIPAAARNGAGIDADYRLIMDIRHFEADYAGGGAPSAVIEVNAKLVHMLDHAIAGNRTFRQVQPAAGTEVARVSDAFSQALASVGGEIAGWALQSGQAHEQAPKH